MVDEELKAKITASVDIDPVTGCWNWCGGSTNGTPYTNYKKKTVVVRRWLFESQIGIIHRAQATPGCGNRKCVNPEHTTLIIGGDAARKYNRKYQTEEEANLAHKNRNKENREKKKQEQWASGERMTKEQYLELRKNRTHCKNGHPWKDFAMIVKRGKYTVRRCRKCESLQRRKNNDQRN